MYRHGNARNKKVFDSRTTKDLSKIWWSYPRKRY